jgi:carbonic anhydrase
MKFKNVIPNLLIFFYSLFNQSVLSFLTRSKQDDLMNLYNFFDPENKSLKVQRTVLKNEPNFLQTNARLNMRNKVNHQANQNNDYSSYLRSMRSHMSRVRSDRKTISLRRSQTLIKRNFQNRYPNFLQKSSDAVYENWFSIASPEFLKKDQYPKIYLPDGNTTEIKTDEHNARYNAVYDFPNKVNPDEYPPGKYFFWFRLSNKHIYYSSTHSDLNILGAIEITKIDDVELEEGISGTKYKFCFSLTDEENKKWNLCGMEKKTVQSWICEIKRQLGVKDKLCGDDVSTTITDDSTQKKIQPLIIIPIPSRFCNDDFDWQKHGEDWECDCKDGKEQSPIEINKKTQKFIQIKSKPEFIYFSVNMTAEGSQYTMNYEKAGYHRIKVKSDDDKFGEILTPDGGIYYAQEIVLHYPGEHRINGIKPNMEIQVIHYGKTKGDIAKIVVLTFPIFLKNGYKNKFLNELSGTSGIPNIVSPEIPVQKIYIPSIFYSTEYKGDNLLKSFSFYQYEGSLSFPPCTERATYYVVKDKIYANFIQIQQFGFALKKKDIIDRVENKIFTNRWIPQSDRSLQSLNGRQIYYFDSGCEFNDSGTTENDKGHYEKVNVPYTEYFYVNTNKPSGVPESYVVSDNEANGLTETYTNKK